MQLRVSERSGGSFLVSEAGIDAELGVIGLGRLLASAVGRKVRRRSCPVCGWTREQALATGLMGCGACYEVLDGA